MLFRKVTHILSLNVSTIRTLGQFYALIDITYL